MKSIGTDLVKLERIKEIGIEKFAERILSPKESVVFKTITNELRKLTFLAGRFAAKEALFKCFKKGDLTANYKDFEILNDENGAPYIESKYTKELISHITITHTEEFAIAFIVLEYAEYK
ncbi:holo-ACP synthase [Acholeplasma equirhinis]|nr:holo-ACP synthase [Acholeplasma equirhinis]